MNTQELAQEACDLLVELHKVLRTATFPHMLNEKNAINNYEEFYGKVFSISIQYANLIKEFNGKETKP